MLKTLLFDMGNVLVRFSHEKMCQQIGSLCGRTAAEMRTLLLDSGLQWDFERGKLSEAEFHQTLQQLTDTSFPLADLQRAGSDIFETDVPLRPIIQQLKSQGYRLVLLSNTSVAHFRWVQQQYDILNFFDDYVLSCQVGALKPDPAIFAAALAAIHCDPQQCLYTDDIPPYITAARTHGLHAEVYTDVATYQHHLSQFGIQCTCDPT